MKKTVLTILLAFCAIAMNAQKPVVVVDYFKYTKEVKSDDAIAIRTSVIAGINALNRVNLIDVDSESTLAMEASRRNSELAVEDQTAREGAMKTLGANYVITGVVSKAEAMERKNEEDGSVYYVGNIVFAINLVDVANGTVVGTEHFTYTGLTGNTGSSPNEAITRTMGRIKQSMDNFVNEYFKISGKVVEMNEASKKGDKAVSLYISLGSDSGLAAQQMLEVFEVKTIAGREAETSIGDLKIEEVVAPDLSLCKVTKGGKEIMDAFKKGSEMRVKTRKDTGFKNFITGVTDSFK
ncbi:MAG: hypothetical protein ACI4TM_04310 [Candidatus Cryptobacteroides sp.]